MQKEEPLARAVLPFCPAQSAKSIDKAGVPVYHINILIR